jgi:hypothetical protein
VNAVTLSGHGYAVAAGLQVHTSPPFVTATHRPNWIATCEPIDRHFRGTTEARHDLGRPGLPCEARKAIDRSLETHVCDG